MLRRVMKDDTMRWITQKCGPTLLGMQNPLHALPAQIIRDTRLGGDPAHQALRTMRIEVIDDDMPARHRRIAGHHGLDMRQKIGLSTGGRRIGSHHLSGDYVPTEDKRTGAMANIFKFTPFDLARGHGQTRVFTLQGLHARQLVGTDGAFTGSGAGRGVPIDGTDILDFVRELRVLRGRQPIPPLMRFEVPLFSNRAA